MFDFFNKGYTALRKDKKNLYTKVKIYTENSREIDIRHWPICHYPPFHSFSEFGLHFAGIFLKPILCFGSLLWSLMKSMWHFIESVACLLFLWDARSSIKEFGNSVYEASNAIYMLLSAIVDPVLTLFSLSLRCISSLVLGLSYLFADEDTSKIYTGSTRIKSPLTPNVGSFGDITEVQPKQSEVQYLGTPNTQAIDDNSPPIVRNSSSLQTITLSGILEEDVNWQNAPMI